MKVENDIALKRKIIYVYGLRYTNRDIERFGANYLMDEEYHVEMWSVLDDRTEKAKDFVCSLGYSENNNVFVMNFTEYEDRLRENKDALFFLYINIRNNRFLRGIYKYRCQYLLFTGLGLIYTKQDERISRKNDKNAIRRHCKLIYEKGIMEYWKYITDILKSMRVDYLSKYYIRKNPPVKIVCATRESKKGLQRELQKCDIEYIHAQDYDRYIELERENKGSSNSHIVYVDCGFGSTNLDYTLYNLENPFIGHEKDFFSQLEEMFFSLEMHYGVPVVIAGHPHVSYPEGAFHNRKIIFGKTHELVRGAKLVVMQMSTAINFVILYRKPLLVIKNHLFEQLKTWETYFQANNELFGLTPCNLDETIERQEPWKFIQQIDEKICEDYIKKYVKEEGTGDKLIIERVEEILKLL